MVNDDTDESRDSPASGDPAPVGDTPKLPAVPVEVERMLSPMTLPLLARASAVLAVASVAESVRRNAGRERALGHWAAMLVEISAAIWGTRSYGSDMEAVRTEKAR